MKVLSHSKYLTGVMELVFLADVNYLTCKIIYDTIDAIKTPYHNFLLITANNAFYEAVSILHTLISSVKKEELIIAPLLKTVLENEKKNKTPITVSDSLLKQFTDAIAKDYPGIPLLSYDFLQEGDDRLVGDVAAELRRKKRLESAKVDFEKLKKQFEVDYFHRIRHISGAHKNKFLASPAGSVRLLLRNDYIEKLGLLVKDLKINCYFWFDYSLHNPNFATVLELEKLLKNIGK